MENSTFFGFSIFACVKKYLFSNYLKHWSKRPKGDVAYTKVIES